LQPALEDSQVALDRIARGEECVPKGSGQPPAGREGLQMMHVLDHVAHRRLQPPPCTPQLRGSAHPSRRVHVILGSGERLHELGPEGPEVGLAVDLIEQGAKPALPSTIVDAAPAPSMVSLNFLKLDTSLTVTFSA
jgi:hypothetical protein